MNWGTVKSIFVTSKVFGIEKIRGFKANILVSFLGNDFEEDYAFKFSKKFEKKIS